MIGPGMAYDGVSDNPIAAIVVVMLTIIVLTVYILIEKRNRKKTERLKMRTKIKQRNENNLLKRGNKQERRLFPLFCFFKSFRKSCLIMNGEVAGHRLELPHKSIRKTIGTINHLLNIEVGYLL